MARPSKSKKPESEATSVAPKDINGDISATNQLDTKDSTSLRANRKRAGAFTELVEDKAPILASKDVAAASTKSRKKAKTDISKEKKVKPSKADGHPVETEKTLPGGDIVEVEPKKNTSGSKKGKTSKLEDQDLNAEDLEAEVSKTKPKRLKKSAIAEAAPSQQTAVRSVAAPKSAVATTDSTTTPKAKNIKKAKNGEDSTAAVEKTVANERINATEAPSESKPKSKKSKAGTQKADVNVEGPVSPNQAMDQAPFKKLLKREQAKPAAVIASAAAAKSTNKSLCVKKSKGASVTKGQAESSTSVIEETDGQKSTDDKQAPAHPTGVTGSKGRKRKASNKGEASTVNPDTLGQAEEEASAKKKHKKSRLSVMEAASNAVGDLVASGIETATKGINAAKEFASGGEKSAMEDITKVAEGAVDAKLANEEKGNTKAKAGKDKGKTTAKSSEADNITALSDGVIDDEIEEDSDDSEDDQTAALIKGFDPDDEEVESREGFTEGLEVPKLPKEKDIPKKLKAIKDTSNGPGVIYVGRIPHGFFESQMRQYFSQFGTVLRLRLSRNKTTGASKHYAFIEFESAAVANIAAESMDNYLMFGHILKCKLVPKEQVHENLWKGANKRFKKVPWSKIEGRKLEGGASRERWEKRVKTEKKRRETKAEKMKEIGYEIESELKEVKDVPVKEAEKAIEEEQVEEEKTIVTGAAENGAVVVSEEIKTKKLKKGEKRKVEEKQGDTADSAAKKRVRKPKKTADS